jgi:hypothetical protein
MPFNDFTHRLAVLAGACMILAGVGIAGWALAHVPPELLSRLAVAQASDLATFAELDPAQLAAISSPLTLSVAPGLTNGDAIGGSISPLVPVTQSAANPVVEPAQAGPVIYATLPLPASLQQAFEQQLPAPTVVVSSTPAALLDEHLLLSTSRRGARWRFREVYTAARRFDTIDLNISLSTLEAYWGDKAAGTQETEAVTPQTAPDSSNNREGSNVAVPVQPVAVLSSTLPALAGILGEPGPNVVGYATAGEVITAVWQTNALAVLPFEQVTPRLAVLKVDGQTPVENSAFFDISTYPLQVQYYVTFPSDPVAAATAANWFAQLPSTNRDPARLTVVAMTGVTAMVRLTAAQMDRLGWSWPAEVVGPTLSAADITVISNEVPFVADCETDTSSDNLVFCSKPEYFATLLASGVDIIGLTGNHQNDYGYAAARASLEFYAEQDIPVYGGGHNLEDALAPLIIEHNGNRFAFLGANSYGPPSAWATQDSPGSAPFDLNIMSAFIRELKSSGEVDVVFAELQYQESYQPEPLYDQRLDFMALARTGADIVTGVQSHVPQGVEFFDDRLILYGLGNLYFDQMWQEQTRQAVIAKHTLYDGRHLSTQILPTVLYEYGQPRWADPEQHQVILSRMFAASYWPD